MNVPTLKTHPDPDQDLVQRQFVSHSYFRSSHRCSIYPPVAFQIIERRESSAIPKSADLINL